VLARGVLVFVLALVGEALVLLGVVGDEVIRVSIVVASFLQTPNTPVIQAVVVKPRKPANDQCQLTVPKASNYFTMIDTKEDKANNIYEGLAEEFESLPETRAIVGAEGFLILA
jgi:hypothetical protein